MKIEKVFTVRLCDESLSYVTFIYDFDSNKLYHNHLMNEENLHITAIRMTREYGICEWVYNIDFEVIMDVMLREHNAKSKEAYIDMNDRFLEGKK